MRLFACLLVAHFCRFYRLGHNSIVLMATLGNIVSIAFFNFFGISVTKEMSATTRMVLDSVRTFADGYAQADDITVLVVRYLGAA